MFTGIDGNVSDNSLVKNVKKIGYTIKLGDDIIASGAYESDTTGLKFGVDKSGYLTFTLDSKDRDLDSSQVYDVIMDLYIKDKESGPNNPFSIQKSTAFVEK